MKTAYGLHHQMVKISKDDFLLVLTKALPSKQITTSKAQDGSLLVDVTKKPGAPSLPAPNEGQPPEERVERVERMELGDDLVPWWMEGVRGLSFQRPLFEFIPM